MPSRKSTALKGPTRKQKSSETTATEQSGGRRAPRVSSARMARQQETKQGTTGRLASSLMETTLRAVTRESMPLLRMGSQGAEVKTLQSRLNALGFNAGVADGIFGQQTLNAVIAFQRAQGLVPDGVVGPMTWARLGFGESTGAGGRTVVGYVSGVAQQITVKPIPGGKELRTDAADAFTRMHAGASAAGVSMVVESAFRTMAEQRALYQAYLNGTGNLAAEPGYSNHQGGIAVDIRVGNTSSTAYRWLAANAQVYGFIRTVPSEPWHWEYRR